MSVIRVYVCVFIIKNEQEKERKSFLTKIVVKKLDKHGCYICIVFRWWMCFDEF